MDIVSFNNKEQEIAEAIHGAWGKEVYADCKLVYCGQIVFCFGKLDVIKKRIKKQVYDFASAGKDFYVGVIKD